IPVSVKSTVSAVTSTAGSSSLFQSLSVGNNPSQVNCASVNLVVVGPPCKTVASPFDIVWALQGFGQFPGGTLDVFCSDSSCTDTMTTDIFFNVVDTVTLNNPSKEEKGIWVNGQTQGGQQWDHQTFTSTSDTINLGENLVASPLENGNEIVAFTNNHPVALLQNVKWTDNADLIPVALQNEIQIPLRVWILTGSYNS